MFQFTLMKNLYYELDPEKMKDSREVRDGDSRIRTMPLNMPDAPDFYSVTSLERFLPYSTMYFLYINDDKRAADLSDPRTKRFLLTFYRTYFPDYLKEEFRKEEASDSGSEMTEDYLNKINILDCFDPDRMPGYENHFAYHEILTLKDLRAGKTGDEHKSKTAFPGMRFTKKYQPE